MNGSRNRVIAATLVAALAVAMIAPAAAVAGNGRGNSAAAHAAKAARDASGQVKPGKGVGRSKGDKRWTEKRRTRIRRVMTILLANKMRRFDNAADAIERKLDRIAGFSSLIATAGGDVSKVDALLAEARAKLAEARAAADAATALLSGVADAENPKAAFQAARAEFKKAVFSLKAVRRLAVQALVTLRTEAAKSVADADEGSENASGSVEASEDATPSAVTSPTVETSPVITP